MSDRPSLPTGAPKSPRPAQPVRNPGTTTSLQPATNGTAASRRLDACTELDVLIRARYAIIYVVSWEEDRVERYLREIAERRDKHLFVWTVTQGITKCGAEPPRAKSGAGSTADPLAALDAVIQHVEPAIYLFKDFHRFCCEDRCNIAVIRRLRDLAHQLRDTYKTLVIVAPSLQDRSGSGQRHHGG